MSTLFIYCYPEGKVTNNPKDKVLIEIPQFCVLHNIKSVVDSSSMYFEQNCSDCFDTYPQVWENRIIHNTAVAAVAKIDGTACNYCGEYYKYAVPNLPGGDLKCYSCRTSFVLTKLYK